MSAGRFGDGATIVISDSEFGVLFGGGADRFGRDALILTFRDDATHEQRLEVAQTAVEIRAAQKAGT